MVKYDQKAATNVYVQILCAYQFAFPETCPMTQQFYFLKGMGEEVKLGLERVQLVKRTIAQSSAPIQHWVAGG